MSFEKNYGGVALPPSPPVSPLAAIGSVLDQAAELALRVQKLTDEVLGSELEVTSEKTANAVPEGTIKRVVDKAARTSQIIAGASRALNRLERDLT